MRLTPSSFFWCFWIKPELALTWAVIQSAFPNCDGLSWVSTSESLFSRRSWNCSRASCRLVLKCVKARGGSMAEQAQKCVKSCFMKNHLWAVSGCLTDCPAPHCPTLDWAGCVPLTDWCLQRCWGQLDISPLTHHSSQNANSSFTGSWNLTELGINAGWSTAGGTAGSSREDLRAHLYGWARCKGLWDPKEYQSDGNFRSMAFRASLESGWLCFAVIYLIQHW